MNNKLRRYNMIDLERLEADRDAARVTFDAFDAIEEYKPALTAIAAIAVQTKEQTEMTDLERLKADMDAKREAYAVAYAAWDDATYAYSAALAAQEKETEQ
jgi:predicted phosphatase